MLNEENHVFIVGLPRTGTSIVYRTIQKLPRLKAKKINLWETGIFLDRTAFNTAAPDYPALKGYLFNEKAAYESFLNSIKKYTDKLQGKPGIKYRLNFRKGTKPVEKIILTAQFTLNRWKWKRSPRNKIIREFFNRAREQRGVERLVEKTPHHYLNVHQILWTFPNARVIWMIRHPVDIFTSAAKRAKNDKIYQNYWQPDNFVREFRGSFTLFNFYKRRFSRSLLMVKYEDFVSGAAKQLEKICAFLDEPFDRGALDMKEEEAFDWKPDPHLSSKIVKKTEKKWRDFLSMEDARKIEEALFDLMKEHGFDFYSYRPG